MDNIDAIVEEGLTVDSLFPSSERCKARLGSDRINLPISEMDKLVANLREDGFIIEVREQPGYTRQCAW